MNEIGIDLSQKIPKCMEELKDREFDYVITLDKSTSRLTFQRAEAIHWKFDDPIVVSNDPERQLRSFRMVRDQIAQRLRLFTIVHVRLQTPSAPATLSMLQGPDEPSTSIEISKPLAVV
jgi:hypothetical protein